MSFDLDEPGVTVEFWDDEGVPVKVISEEGGGEVALSYFGPRTVVADLDSVWRNGIRISEEEFDAMVKERRAANAKSGLT